jgi:hypothetical protein
MKKLYLFSLLLLLISSSAHAGEWVLWKGEFMPRTDINPPIPLTEHKSLKECQDASTQAADNTVSLTKTYETVQTDSVKRFTNPDAVYYKYKESSSVRVEFRCYPYGVVAVQEYFQSVRATQ